ncbi:unnamed protein product, partial [Rotaria magnacalcarata]
NRRFGGDANLCHQATQLLLTADLLMEEPANLSLTSVQDIHLASFSEQENSNSIHGDSIASIVTQSLPINDTSSILIQSTLFSSAPIGKVFIISFIFHLIC